MLVNAIKRYKMLENAIKWARQHKQSSTCAATRRSRLGGCLTIFGATMNNWGPAHCNKFFYMIYDIV